MTGTMLLQIRSMPMEVLLCWAISMIDRCRLSFRKCILSIPGRSGSFSEYQWDSGRKQRVNRSLSVGWLVNLVSDIGTIGHGSLMNRSKRKVEPDYYKYLAG